MEATISADIIRSTSLPKEGMIVLQERLREFVEFINKTFDGCWGRVVRGDANYRQMISLAEYGEGLNAFIVRNREVRIGYERKYKRT